MYKKWLMTRDSPHQEGMSEPHCFGKGLIYAPIFPVESPRYITASIGNTISLECWLVQPLKSRNVSYLRVPRELKGSLDFIACYDISWEQIST